MLEIVVAIFIGVVSIGISIVHTKRMEKKVLDENKRSEGKVLGAITAPNFSFAVSRKCLRSARSVLLGERRKYQFLADLQGLQVIL